VVIWFDVLISFYRTLSVWHGAKLCVRLFYAVWRKSVISIRQRTLRGKAAGGERREAKGFSHSNVRHTKQWYLFYNQQIAKGQRPIGFLSIPEVFRNIPWGHHIDISLTTC
jgi:hypothetical protein